MTKRAGKRKNRQGVGPLKPPPGPQGPVHVENSVLTGVDNLPESESVAMSLRALQAGWLLTTDAKIREGLIAKMLNLAAEAAKKPVGQMTDLEFDRLLSIFRAVSSVEQRQQRLEISKAMAILRAITPRQSHGELPQQTVNVGIVNGSPVSNVESVPTWMAVQQLLKAPEVQEAVKTLPSPQRMSDQLSPQAG